MAAKPLGKVIYEYSEISPETGFTSAGATATYLYACDTCWRVYASEDCAFQCCIDVMGLS